MKKENKAAQQSKKDEYKFFSHVKCEYFPCHKTDEPQNFNCLFCYCPLYVLGDACGGNFSYTKEGYKDCTKCMLPHKRVNYDYIVSKYKNIADAMKKVKSSEDAKN